MYCYVVKVLKEMHSNTSTVGREMVLYMEASVKEHM